MVLEQKKRSPLSKYRKQTLIIALALIVGAIALFIFGVLPGYAQEKEPTEKPIGVVIIDEKIAPSIIAKFPGITHVWGYSHITNRNIENITDIAWNEVSTMVSSAYSSCNEIELTFHSPNMPFPYGQPIMERDEQGKWSINSPEAAIDLLLELEKECPDTKRIVFTTSPHDFCDWPGGYCGTGAEYLDEALGYYEEVTGNEFPHVVGIVLSENNSKDEYPIAYQAGDYYNVKLKYDVEMWVMYLNVKYGNEQEWKDALQLGSWFDGMFVATITSPSSCFRSLYCNGSYTVSGEALMEYLRND